MNMVQTILKISAILFFLILASCGGDKEHPALTAKDSLRLRIDTLERKINEVKASNKLDVKLAGITLENYMRFASAYKDDSLSAWYLYRAADLASGALGQHARAVDIYEQIIANYKKFSKYPDCLFLAGFICQDKLQDGVRAKKHYDELIANYPNHEFTDDAKAMISFFGKSDEEIIREFEKKNEEKLNK